ncbi:hypothetical protein KY289_003431 [Solanum tuberosum]|nr:hypothetical protein KY289_003431 [Solanum tuberosum]
METLETKTSYMRAFNYVWRNFGDMVGVEGPFLQSKDSVYKWWNTNVLTKLKLLLIVVPMIPNNWPDLVRYLANYTPMIGCKVVYWNLPRENSFKCNTDGASKSNHGSSFAAFGVRNDQGDLIHAERKVIEVANNLVAEIVALRLGLEFCRNQNLFPTDSLAATNMIDGTETISFTSFQDLPNETKTLLNMDKRKFLI